LKCDDETSIKAMVFHAFCNMFAILLSAGWLKEEYNGCGSKK
jgi:hypothetical protein